MTDAFYDLGYSATPGTAYDPTPEFDADKMRLSIEITKISIYQTIRKFMSWRFIDQNREDFVQEIYQRYNDMVYKINQDMNSEYMITIPCSRILIDCRVQAIKLRFITEDKVVHEYVHDLETTEQVKKNLKTYNMMITMNNA